MQPDAHRPGRAGSRWTAVLAGALLLVAALFAYHNCFRVPFIFDDEAAVTQNQTIRHLSRIGTVLAADTGNGAGVRGRPVINLSLAINYVFSGTDVGGYHATNLAIHLLVALLLFGIVRRTLRLMPLDGPIDSNRLTGDRAPRLPDADGLAFFAALLWTVHPLQSETVVCVVQRTESIMGLFYLLTLYCFIRGIEMTAGPMTTRPRVGRTDSVSQRSLVVRSPWSHGLNSGRSPLWFTLCFLACLLGMASKEVMASAPLVVLLYDRTFVAGTFREAWARRKRLYLALASTWLLLAGLIATENGRGGTVGFGLGVSPWDYALTQCRALVMYLKLCLWPHPLVVDYGTYLDHRLLAVLPQALLVVGLLVLTGWALVRRPKAGFFGAWFFLVLAPSSSFIPLASQTIGEHRMYLPLAAIVVPAVLGLFRLLGRRILPVGLALAVALGWVTARRVDAYRTELGIWRDTVAEVPDSARAHYNLGVLLGRDHRRAEAVAQFHEALRLNPGYAEAHNNLGSILFQEGRIREAVAQCERAVALNPKLAVAHYNLGRALFGLDRGPEAIAEYEQALHLDPEYAAAALNLGAALLKAGRTQEAIARLQEAVQLAPRDAEARYDLAGAFDQAGRLPEAVAAYEAALRLKPDYPEAHNNLAYVLVRLGRTREALTQVEEAVRLRPDDPNSRVNLGNLFIATGRYAEATAAYRAALRLAPGDVETHFNLAQALLQEGRGSEAVAELRETLRLKPDYAPARALLERIQAGAP